MTAAGRASEAEQCRAELARVQAELAAFLLDHGTSPSLFYQGYNVGQTADRLAYAEWLALLQRARELENRLRVLGQA
jgi:hypothetical protein